MTAFRESDPTVPTTDTAAPAAVPTTATAGVRRPALRRTFTFAAAGLVVALTAGGAVAATAHKTVEIDVDGQERTVATFAGSVGGALAHAGIDVAARDSVTPAVDTAIADGAEIVVRHAQALDVSVAGRTQTIWTTAATTTEALADLAAAGRGGSVVASRAQSDGRPQLALPVASGGTVVVSVDGTTLDVPVNGLATVDDVLTAAGVVLGDLDRVVVANLPDGRASVTVVRLVRGERVETVVVEHGTSEQPDSTLYEGDRRVIQAGVDGAIDRSYRTLTVDGVETSAILTGEVVTVEAVTEIVAVGTKERPTSAANITGVWAALAQCESGGNPTAVSANGLYYGLYQFSVGTWQAVGGSGLPSQASAAEQTERAQILQARAGWGQWPACAAKLGLL